jgi:hypothetical protein
MLHVVRGCQLGVVLLQSVIPCRLQFFFLWTRGMPGAGAHLLEADPRDCLVGLGVQMPLHELLGSQMHMGPFLRYVTSTPAPDAELLLLTCARLV